MILSGNIPVERSLRYAVRNAEATPIHLVYILHGYGQLAPYFLKKVEHLLPENVCFVAPEGMHRFYLSGSSGRVGASWMTSEARELDITENTLALDRLHSHLLNEVKPEKVTVIGFSQGGATAARWIANGNIDAACFVSWASVFPPDIAFPEGSRFQSEKNVFVLGDSDVFFDEAAVRQASSDYEARGFEVRRFKGGHDLDASLVERLILEL